MLTSGRLDVQFFPLAKRKVYCGKKERIVTAFLGPENLTLLFLLSLSLAHNFF